MYIKYEKLDITYQRQMAKTLQVVAVVVLDLKYLSSTKTGEFELVVDY